MELEQYCAEALRTEKRIDEVVVNHQNLDNLLQAYIQIGNILDTVKKQVFYGKPVDLAAQNKRLSTTLSAAASLLGESIVDENATPLKTNSRIFHAIVGIATESTELVEALYKAEFEQHPLDLVNLTEEAADIDWYSAILHDQVGIPRSESLKRNNAKLRVRFSDKFTEEQALTRDLEAERGKLEGN